MRAPGLLPLLLPLLLLLGVNSQADTTSGSPEQTTTSIKTTVTTKTVATTGASKMQETTASSSPESKSSTSKASTVNQVTTPATVPATSTPSDKSSHSDQGPAPTNASAITSPTHALSPATTQEVSTIDSPGSSSRAHTTLSHTSQQVSSTASSGASPGSPSATSAGNRSQDKPPEGSKSVGSTTAAKPVPTPTNSPPTTSGGLKAATTAAPRSEAQATQPPDHLTPTTVSPGVPGSSVTRAAKDLGVLSPTPATTQPRSSSSSPAQDLPSSTRPASANTSVMPLNGSLPIPSSKTSLTSSPDRIHSTPEVSIRPSPATGDQDQKSHDVGPTSAKPTSASRGPASAKPPPPAPGDQTVPSSPWQQHLNTSLHNEVICKDAEGAPAEVQNNWLTMYLKEAKTCDEWRTASTSISFFESLCSTGWHTFNASRETCTVTLMSQEPQSQQWAMQVVLHIPLHPEDILEKVERRDKLEELGIGIANITNGRADKDMIINDEFSTPLIITIVTLAGSLLLVAAIYSCCHQRFSQKKDQHIHPDVPGFDDGHVALIFNQRLTEELQTMENGYHDNPTLEVMETSSEMQEKKVNLNGELGDSWIVPLDTLMKEDLEEEEDTHL